MSNDSDVDESRPSVIDAMQSCEHSSSAKEDSSGHDMRLLPEGYKPGEHDVLCGRGRKCFNHPGNVKFRSIVQSFLPQYSRSVAKLEKSYILSDVVEQVRKNSGDGGFIKKDPDTGRWYEVGDFLAREKTSQAFRDVLHDKYKSSNTAKKKRRQEDQAEKLFRAHSNRSLGASSLDASSVHSVGSSTTGDYMLADSKLMRMEHSNSVGNLNDGLDNEDEFAEEDDLLSGLDHSGLDQSGLDQSGLEHSGLDQGGSNHSRSSAHVFHRQRSLRSVLDFDTNRRTALSSAKTEGPMSYYASSSCPNLFGGNPAPPVSQIEIIREQALSGGMQGRRHKSRLHMAPEPLGLGFEPDMDSFGTAATTETTVASTTGSEAGGQGQQDQRQMWFHHSQPNLFGDTPPVNPQGGQRSQFARQTPDRLMRRHGGPTRVNSGGLATVQQQIGNLGLNDSNHGVRSGCGLDGSNHSSSYPQAVTSQGNGGGSQRNSYDSNDGSVGDNENNFMPQCLRANPHPSAILCDPGIISHSLAAGSTISSVGNGASPKGKIEGGGGDADLLARLSALENTGFGMDVIDENPFEPVPLREE